MQVSPLDFPQVWQKPSYEELLTCLKKLRLEPPIWNPSTTRKIILEDHENSARFRKEVAAYLGNIIKSELKWIEDEDEKEAIWDEASRRLSERCGRAGMGEITRRWPFESEAYPAFELIIREPPITGDSLGLKTWGSSYALARLFDQIAAKSLSHLLSSPESKSAAKVLELGSGTGLCGMAAAAIWKSHVFLSDLPIIVSNLSYNMAGNCEAIEALGGKIDAGALTWGQPSKDDEIFKKKNQFKIILIADALYDDDHPTLLASAVKDHLLEDDDARVVMMTPFRDATTRKLFQNFRHDLAQGSRPLVCLEEHTIMGQDDWEDAPPIESWWGIFGSNATF